MTPSNRELYETAYTWDHLERLGTTRYDRGVHELRSALLDRHARGTTLDLCCGTGLHLATAAAAASSVVGLDLSQRMLDGARTIRPALADRVVQADATRLPFATASFDTVFSFGSLYTVPGVDLVVDEVRRVLRPGGTAILELGNRTSLNTALTRAHHRESGWAAPTSIPFGDIGPLVARLGRTVEWHTLQLLPMLRTTRSTRYLAPLAHPGWKLVLGWGVKGRMLDEWLSSAPGIRRVAFRHLVVVRRG